MRFALASRHPPDPEGSAAGRILDATCAGLLAEGHDLQVLVWGPDAPDAALPWCAWRPPPPEPAWRTRARALAHPRTDSARVGFQAAPGAVAVAEEPPSHAAVAGADPVVTVLHYLTALDVPAAGQRWRLADLQHRRAERRAARHSQVVLAYSPRVAQRAARLTGAPVAHVPAAIQVPAEPLPPIDAPVAALLADWRWPPNRAALGTLLGAWPAVREAVPAARLLLAGRGDPGVGSVAGIRWLGQVGSSRDVLAESSVLAFPCPATSGPKVKVLEACAAGLAVVTTPAGVEGLQVPAGSVAVSAGAGFAAALASALADPEGRAVRAAAARDAVRRAHGPRPAARARVEAVARALGG